MPEQNEPIPQPKPDYEQHSHYYAQTPRSGNGFMRRSIPFLWAAVIILLLLNIALLYILNRARLTAIDTLTQVETTLNALANEVVVYNVDINQQVPMKADIPFNRTMEIPLNTVIPIDQVLTVPFQDGIELDLPVKANFPINMVVPVTLNETIDVDTQVELNTSIPVEIEIARTPLIHYLAQTQEDIVRLKNRLALPSESLPVIEPINIAVTERTTKVNDTSTKTDGAQVEPESEVNEAQSAGVVDEAAEAETSETSDAATGALVSCSNIYFPLQPGTTWTYNSPDSSYTQRVDNIDADQAHLSTQYEGQDIQFSLDCIQGDINFLGDMRRITEFGNLKFDNPQGVFLSDSATMAQIENSWIQEYEVSGTIEGLQGDRPVIGQITDGKAQAVYTATDLETVETPLGPQEAIRLEQILDLELQIDFNLAGQTIPATQQVSLTNIYWLAQDIGLVKMHWQGGSMEQAFEINQTPVSKKTDVPALAEDQLVFVCIMLEEGSFECKNTAGVSQSNLSPPADSELVVPIFVFPNEGRDTTSGATPDESEVTQTDSSNGTATPDKTTSTITPTPKPEVNPTSTSETAGNDAEEEALLAYAASVENIGDRISEAAGPFQKAILAYRDDQLTIDEFRAEFEKFDPRVKNLIRQINQLSPPPTATAIHQKLIGGFNKCEQGVNMLDEWLNTFDDSLKAPATLLVIACIDEANSASTELKTLTN